MRVSVSRAGSIIEGAIDEIVFWDPVCEIHDPAPNPVDTLTVDLDGSDVMLGWSRPGIDPSHGETNLYRVYRSETASTGYLLLGQVTDPSANTGFTDNGAVNGPTLLFYQVIAANDAGDADTLP